MKTFPTSTYDRVVPAAALLATFLLTTGCVTRGYKRAAKDTPPIVSLDLPATLAPPPPAGDATTAAPGAPPAAEARLQSVIVFRGPGSWKREAYWDEYILAVTNRGETPLTITAATLQSALGLQSEPHDDPWRLDRLSKTWWQSNAGSQARTYLALGAGTVTAAGLTTAIVLGNGFWVPLSGAAAAGATAGAAVAVALPAVAVGTIVANVRGKRAIEAEFMRRRLALPLTLAPGQSTQGSLFFQITPAPSRLSLRGESAGRACELDFNLAPLATLHVNSTVAAGARAKP